MTYLDYAAATPVDKKVFSAMEPYLSDTFFNPSAAYLTARQVRSDYEKAKHEIAQVIGAKTTEITITSGATESIALALNGHEKILTTPIEHIAVLENAKTIQMIPIDSSGRVKIDVLSGLITDEITLISVGYANNEIGVIQNIKEISKICQKIRIDRAKRGILTTLVLHTDASQAIGYLDVNVARLDVDLMTLNSAKCYGPKGVGLLYVRTGSRIKPMFDGGGQESGLRSGTENVPGVIGFAKAIEIAEKKRKSETKRLCELRMDLIKFLKNELSIIAPVFINSNSKHCLPNLINFSVSGVDGERIVYALDQQDIMISTGSACAANSQQRSHVLRSIGLSDDEADSSLRISMGRSTTVQEVDQFKKTLIDVVKRERSINA